MKDRPTNSTYFRYKIDDAIDMINDGHEHRCQVNQLCARSGWIGSWIIQVDDHRDV